MRVYSIYTAFVLYLFTFPCHQLLADEPTGTIAFSSLAPRGWDLYLIDLETGKNRRLTKHPALDYNAKFARDGKSIAFVSERNGNLEIYRMDLNGSQPKRMTSEFAMDDHPAWSPDGKRLAFVSTRQPAKKAGQAWNAVYVMNANGGKPHRLTPKHAADYSPAWSPKGNLIAVASGSGRAGASDIAVMNADGAGRRTLIKNGGWPAFSADGQSVYFHRKEKNTWGIWRTGIDGKGLKGISPPKSDAFTPNASADGKYLVGTMKSGERRRIFLLSLSSGKLTLLTDAKTDCWNPSLSPDSRYVVYHKGSPGFVSTNVELWGSPSKKLQMVRTRGAFPFFSPNGKQLTLTGGNFSRLDVMNVDGSKRRTIYSGKARTIFSLSWGHGDSIAFSHGRAFQEPKGLVDIATIHPTGKCYNTVTKDKANDAFPSFSPDGKQLVFRSGRSGSKNLYTINADGTGPRRLTKGKWTDTMADWSPDGKWIAFASDRGKNFEIWLIRPDGSGLKKLIGGGGRHNHPHFSPDMKWIVFTSQRAGYCAEEISLPHQFQPYGSLFAIRLDGSGLVRLTHNGFEEGTPAWGPILNIQPSNEGSKRNEKEY